ncbi:MAG TPA: anthranilate synthase component I family protein [Nocardioidaceae bacterium]|nr:anthranilate synthase component I family protein [Nocardioidaceae bacterium]
MSTDPVELFVQLAGAHERMFWLDGGGSRTWSGRRSILGGLRAEDVSLTYSATSRKVTRHQHGRTDVVGDDPFLVLAEHVARDAGDRRVSWVGYFGYASRPDLPAAPGDPDVPDAVWMRVRDPVFVDHDVPGGALGARSPAVSGRPSRTRPSRVAAPGPGPARDRPHLPDPGYLAAFDRVQTELRRGNSYEVNLTYRESLTSPVDPVSAYLRLRAASPAPYAGFLQHPGVRLLSSSPERFATVDRDGWLETKPIKGTTPRGGTPEQDARHRAELSGHPRYRAENLMIVDLLRNDLSLVCDPGTVTVPVLMEVESYAAVHQLVSTVRGRLRSGLGTVEALRALFPAGSMTGAPKLRTMQIIDAVERSPRGVYAGAFGWVGADGRADLGVVIRSLVATPAPDDPAAWRYSLGTGGGITVRSEATEEYAETRWKAAHLRSAVTGPAT